MQFKNIFAPALLIFSLLGCATFDTYTYQADPQVVANRNDSYEVELKPIPCTSFLGCTGFNLSIKNNTESEIEIDWNKSLFVANGQTNGGFMFEGTVFKDRNNSKDPDVIFANSSFNKKIYPNALVGYNTTLHKWLQAPMYNGSYGAYLRLKVNGKEFSEKLITKITAMKN